MYFDLTEEQKSIRDTIKAVLREHLPDDRVVKQFDAGAVDQQLWNKLSELGVCSILTSSDFEGLDLGLLTLAVVSEALGYAGASIPVVTNALAAWLIAQSGNAEQKSRWVAELTLGKKIAAFALAEPNTGWLPSDWRLPDAPLSGIKTHVQWGAFADIIITGIEGGRLALVEPNAPGVDVSPIDSLDRTHPLAQIAFTHVNASLLSTDARTVERLRDALLILIAADACGAATRALTMAVEYAKVREQFGKLIGSFQALKHQLSNAAAEIEPCRPLYYYAAYAWDKIENQRGRAAAIAKAHICDIAVQISRAAVEAHGGIGYTWEYPLHVWLKRSMADRATLGLPRLHRERAALMANW